MCGRLSFEFIYIYSKLGRAILSRYIYIEQVEASGKVLPSPYYLGSPRTQELGIGALSARALTH